MATKTYSEKLKDQRWQKKRLELFEAAGWKCQSGYCFNEKEKPTLHVHHRVYLKNLNPWEYEPWAYQVLCDECHELAQDQMKDAYIALAKHQSLLEACAWIEYKEHITTNLDDVNFEEFCGAFSDICKWRPELFRAIYKTFINIVESWKESFGAGIHTNSKNDN